MHITAVIFQAKQETEFTPWKVISLLFFLPQPTPPRACQQGQFSQEWRVLCLGPFHPSFKRGEIVLLQVMEPLLNQEGEDV